MSEIKLYSPSELFKDEWSHLQRLQRIAFSSELSRNQDDIDYLVDWDDPERFYESHIDPNNEVGKRFNPDQEFSHARVAVATEQGLPIGFAYSAYNVSGSSNAERRAKRLSIVKNYLWLREFAVNPNYQKKGLAKQLGRVLLEDAISLQPVAAYIWPEEIGFLPDVLNKLGFTATGERAVHLYGEDKPEVSQVRMQAPSVRTVLSKLAD